MVDRFLFKDRDGRTPLSDDFKKDLIPTDVNTGGDLDVYEEENIVEGLIWLDDCEGDHKDWMFWEQLHKKLFGNVWRWAGQFRKHELQNDDFNHPGQIKQNIKKLEGDLGYWLEKNPFKDRREIAVRFHEALLTIHPFSNGNGRTSRILTEYICKREGIAVPTWGHALKADTKKHRNAYIAAVVKARKDKTYEDLLGFMYS